ncbi:R body protein RebB-like protein [Aerophototrophica crusticola]|uniref:R body protein RebB-like protein n=1 Tax=Aerophototrophica crusticola TaxID=1709002 RepID=A0A858R9Y9_9PROT|nr:R body protein RebB-like protein [Rhodospirillaceae bacterium B3]
MSDTNVNPQITDAVTQANVKVVGDAPAIAMGNLYQAAAKSTGILFQNATGTQQQGALAEASTNQGVMQIYAMDTAADAATQVKVAETGVADNLTGLLTVLESFKDKGNP